MLKNNVVFAGGVRMNSFYEIETILNNVNDALIVIDCQQNITIFNTAAEKITKIKAEKVLGKPITEVMPNSRLQYVLKSRRSELNQQIKLGDISIVVNQIPLYDEKGQIKGAFAVFRDTTKVKELTQQITDLRKIKSLLEAILNSTQDAISVVDENGYGIFINPAYTKITGLTEQDVINKHCTVDIAEGESMHMKVLETKKPVRGVSMKVGPNKKHVIVNVAPIIIDGVVKGSVGIIHDITEIRKLTEELENARSLIRRMTAKYTFDDIIGESEPVKAAINQAKHAAGTNATVLLRGESGTGKELFAHAMHNASDRKNGPFVRVNCAAISESILESELFGYEEGAFTGAVRGGKKGYFEEADKGTIFLDEIGDVNLAVQAKLLRVLQEKEIIRVGGTKPVSIDVRVIAATNANLEQRIAEGTFREDLYYRLNMIPIFIPPLRRRKEDIPLLITHFRKKLGQQFGRKVAKISPEITTILMAYDWPGNIRELENVIGQTIINMKYNEEIILPHHVPVLGKSFDNVSSKPSDRTANYIPESYLEEMGSGSLNEILDSFEKTVLRRVLQEVGGNKTAAAKKLGISIRSFYYKLEKHKII